MTLKEFQYHEGPRELPSNELAAVEEARIEVRFRLMGWQPEDEPSSERRTRLLDALEELAEARPSDKILTPQEASEAGAYWLRLESISEAIDGMFTPPQLDMLAERFANPDPLAGHVEGDGRTMRLPGHSEDPPKRKRRRLRERTTAQVVAEALDARLGPDPAGEIAAHPATARKYRQRLRP